MANVNAGPMVSHAWEQLPASPVAPGGGRAPGTDYLRSGLTTVELGDWEALVGERLGLHFPASRIHQLATGLARRLRATQTASTAAYRLRLESDPMEWDTLAGELTIGETRFFRQADMYMALRTTILPEIVRRKTRSGSPELHIWSAGCSSGDEAYSLAIVAQETVRFPWLWDVSVVGTDLSPQALAEAEGGRFAASRVREVPAALLSEHFQHTALDGQVEISRRLRDIVDFRLHNLTHAAWPMARHDVIVCQNVLLYLLPELRLPVLTRLFSSLLPDGYLIVGPAELPDGPLPGGIRPVNGGGVLVYRRS